MQQLAQALHTRNKASVSLEEKRTKECPFADTTREIKTSV